MLLLDGVGHGGGPRIEESEKEKENKSTGKTFLGFGRVGPTARAPTEGSHSATGSRMWSRSRFLTKKRREGDRERGGRVTGWEKGLARSCEGWGPTTFDKGGDFYFGKFTPTLHQISTPIRVDTCPHSCQLRDSKLAIQVHFVLYL